MIQFYFSEIRQFQFLVKADKGMFMNYVLQGFINFNMIEKTEVNFERLKKSLNLL